LPALVQRAEFGLVPGERAIGAADALPGRVHVDVEENRERALEVPADIGGLDGAAARGDHATVSHGELADEHVGLDLAEGRLPVALEDLRDRPEGVLDLPVVVVEPPAETPRDLLGDARLARAHEAYEGDRPV
jgi:hypothetical protein